MADELYGVAPADFTAARDQRARRARAEGQQDLGDEIKKLRRPTVSASLVNRLVREDADQVDRLLDLGESMRDAQQGLAGAQLRRLSAQRRPVIHALAQEAKRLAAQAGQPVSDQVEREIEATLEAALADPGAADAVRSGRLTVALVYAGFGGVDVADAVAVPATPPERSRRPSTEPPDDHAPTVDGQRVAAKQRREDGTPAQQRREEEAAERRRRVDEAADRRRREIEAAERDVREAEAVARDAAAALDDAARGVSEASHVRKAAERRIEDLEQRLEQAHAQEAGAARALRDARRSRDAAARSADAAERRLARVRAKLEASQQSLGAGSARPGRGGACGQG